MQSSPAPVRPDISAATTIAPAPSGARDTAVSTRAVCFPESAQLQMCAAQRDFRAEPGNKRLSELSVPLGDSRALRSSRGGVRVRGRYRQHGFIHLLHK